MSLQFYCMLRRTWFVAARWNMFARTRSRVIIHEMMFFAAASLTRAELPPEGSSDPEVATLALIATARRKKVHMITANTMPLQNRINPASKYSVKPATAAPEIHSTTITPSEDMQHAFEHAGCPEAANLSIVRRVRRHKWKRFSYASNAPGIPKS